MRIKYLLLILFISSILFGQSGGSIGNNDAKSLSMARSGVTTTNGLFALGSNPANLHYLSTSKKVELIIPFPLPTLSISAGTNFITLDEYNYFFGTSTINSKGEKEGRYLTTEDKTRLKNLFDGGGNISADINLTLFGIAIRPSDNFGTLAFSINDVFSSNSTIPKGIIDLALDGNKENSVYNFNDSKHKAWWLRKYSISYARNLNIFKFLENLSGGFSFNIVHGYFYTSIEDVKTELKTGAENVITGSGQFTGYSAFSNDFAVKYDFDSRPKQKENYSFFPSPAGSGIGFDFGLNAKINRSVSFAIALSDIGNVKWTKNVAMFSSTKTIYLDDITDKNQIDSLTDALTGKESGKYISNLSTPLASSFQFGVALQMHEVFNGKFPGRMLLAFEFHQGLNEQPRNSKDPRFSIGIDWGLSNLFSIRSGFSFGGIDKFNWGAGLGFDFGMLELNFGTSDFQYAVAPNSAKRIVVGFDSRWKF
jgi:hypothetical protein